MAQSMLERGVNFSDQGSYRQIRERELLYGGSYERQTSMDDSNDGSLINSSTIQYPEDCTSLDEGDSSTHDGEDIIDIPKHRTPVKITSRRKSSASHRRKSTPKKRAWEPAVYSDGESHHEGSYSDLDTDDLDQNNRDLQNSFSSGGEDFSRRRQVASPDLDDEDRLVIDWNQVPKDTVAKDTVAKDAVAREPYDVLALASRMKQEPGLLIEQWMIQNQEHQYVHQSAHGNSDKRDDVAGRCQSASDGRDNVIPYVKLDNDNKASVKKQEHKCPFCHFVYTSVNYLLSHLYRVHISVNAEELQHAILSITAPYKKPGLDKSTHYSRSPHITENGIVAPPSVGDSTRPSVLTPLNLSANGYDTVDGDLPPLKKTKIDSRSRSQSPIFHNDSMKKSSSESCTKCFMKFSTRHQYEVHVKRNLCGQSDISPTSTILESKPIKFFENRVDSPKIFDFVKTEDTSYSRSDTSSACSRECLPCGRKFTDIRELEMHSREHRSSTPIRCDTCELWFSDKTSLDQHRILHDGLLKCQFCGGEFTQMEVLKKHTESHFNVDKLASMMYSNNDHQSSPSSTDSDKENSPDQDISTEETYLSAPNSSRKHLLAELMHGTDEDTPTSDKTTPTSDKKDSKSDAYLHKCTLCRTSCSTVTALVEHISKCHSQSSSSSILPTIPGLAATSQATMSQSMYMAGAQEYMASVLQNPLMSLYYPYMQNPLMYAMDPKMYANLDPKMYAHLDPKMYANLDPKMYANVDPKMYANSDPKMYGNLDPKMYGNIDPKMYNSILQPNMLMTQLTKGEKTPKSATTMMATPKSATTMMASMMASLAQKQESKDVKPEKNAEETKYSSSSEFTKANNNLMNLLSKETKGSGEKKLSNYQGYNMTPFMQLPSSLPGKKASLPSPKEEKVNKVVVENSGMSERNALIKQQTEAEKPFQCSQCNKRFKRNCHLQLHKRTHTDDLRSYRCPQCGMRFIQLRSLEMHLKTHSIDKPYDCSYCGKSFAQKYNLKLHIRTHTGEKPYKCSYCEMRFADPGSLNRHTRTHTGEKPYSCEYCGKKFAQKYNLHLHIRVHTHDRPFRCVYCEKRFAQKSNLLLHLKVHVEYLQQLQNGTLPNMAELLGADGQQTGDGPVLPSEAELRIIASERQKIEDELKALEKAELADKILSEDAARREKEMIYNRDEMVAMGKIGLHIGMSAPQPEFPTYNDGADDLRIGQPTDLTMNANSVLKSLPDSPTATESSA